MKILIASLCLLIASLGALAQAPPVFEATTNQVAAGIVGAPFYVSPRGLTGAGIGSPTNGETAAQAAAQIASTNNAIIIPNINTSSNLVYGNALTQINTTSNSLNTSINTSSNSVFGNATNSAIQALPSRTNFFQVTNATAGQAVVIVGADVNGQFYLKGTNWPAGGSGGLATSIITTNLPWSDTNTANSYSFLKDTNENVTISTNGGAAVSFGTNGLTVNVGPSNFLGGVTISGAGIGSTRSNTLAPFTITFPATTVNWTNPLTTTIEVYIDNSAVTGTAMKKNGTTIFTSITGDATFCLQQGEYFSETYTIGTPTAKASPVP